MEQKIHPLIMWKTDRMPYQAHDPIVVGRRIRAIRSFAQWSQSQMAEFLDVDRELVSRWERGKSYPSFGVAQRLCDRFRVDFDTIFRGYTKNLPFEVFEALDSLLRKEMADLDLE